MIADHFAQWFPALAAYAARCGCRDPEGFAAEAIAKSLVAERQGKTIERSYVCRAMCNLIIDDARRAKIVAVVPLADALESSDRPAEAVCNALEAERLLGLMTAAQAVAICWRAEGVPLREMAKRLERSEVAVKDLIQRGRATARRVGA